METVTVNVELSHKQAVRINNIAVMLKIKPGELLTWLAFSELEGCADEPPAFLWWFRQNHDDYVVRRALSGENIEAMLRGGLDLMSLGDLIKKADCAADPGPFKSEKAKARSIDAQKKIDKMIAHGKSLAA